MGVEAGGTEVAEALGALRILGLPGAATAAGAWLGLAKALTRPRVGGRRSRCGAGSVRAWGWRAGRVDSWWRPGPAGRPTGGTVLASAGGGGGQRLGVGGEGDSARHSA